MRDRTAVLLSLLVLSAGWSIAQPDAQSARAPELQMSLLSSNLPSVAAPGMPPPPAPPPGVRVLNVLASDGGDSAAKEWKAVGGAAPAEPLIIGGKPVLRFRCNFAGTEMPRAAWGRAIALDLTRATAVVFDVYAGGMAAVGAITLYIRSGDGWYGASWYPKQEQSWRRVRIPKRDFTVDAPGGRWAQVTGLRMSPWALKREDAELCIANFGIEETDGSALIVASDTGSGHAVTVHSLLEEAGLPLPMISMQDLTPELLAAARLVILPHNDNISDKEASNLADFGRRGGRIIACFTLPFKLASLLGVKQKDFTPKAYGGEFSSMRFAGTPPPGVPATVRQSSWAVIRSSPVSGVGTVTAWWHDAAGKRTDAPAIIESKNGAWISHVLLKDDPAAKAALLLGLAAKAVPDLRRQACVRRIGLLGADVGDAGWDDAVRQIKALPDFARDAAPASLEEARALAGKAGAFLAAGDFPAAAAAAAQADERLKRAYCLAQRPIEPEFRSAWCHTPEGIEGWNWEQTAAALEDSGINNLFLNALHGASASYPSRFAPFDKGNSDKRDYLSEAAAACGRHGIKVHVWITNYQLHGHAPEKLEASLRAKGRLQVDRNGKEQAVLCPVNEANVQLQRDLMVEAAAWPGVAGVHFDYIRYPDENTCFCSTCRRSFEKGIGKKTDAWPDAVLPAGPLHAEWLQFRRDAITRLVRDVHKAVRRAAPGCRISAAVFNNHPLCRDNFGQDWDLWVREGLLDFVCPMNYTASDAQFRNMSAMQMGVVGGRIPCYPGIGLIEGLGPIGAVRQIQITRALGAGGFVVFAADPEYISSVFPFLGMGILKGR